MFYHYTVVLALEILMNIDKTQALLVYTFLFAHLGSKKTEKLFDDAALESLLDFSDSLREFLVGSDVSYSRYDEESTDLSHECGGCGSSCEGCDDENDEEKDDHSDDDTDDDDDDDEPVSEKSPLPPVDDFVTPDELHSLPSVMVTSPTGDKITLEFEDVCEDGIVDVLLDEGSVVIESVERLKLDGKTLSLYDGDEWHSFLVQKKLPKSWTKRIKSEKIYGVKLEEEK